MVGTIGGLFLSEMVPVWVFTVGILGAMSMILIVPIVAWWRGRSQRASRAQLDRERHVV